MMDHSKRAYRYSTAVEQIKQILAIYRPDVKHLQGSAVLSPRILTLLIERSRAQIPTHVLDRLQPLAEAVLNCSESGIADFVGSPLPNDVRSKIENVADAAYGPLAELHAEVTNGVWH